MGHASVGSFSSSVPWIVWAGRGSESMFKSCSQMLDISLTIKSLDTRLWAAGNSMADTSLGWLMFLLCGSSVCVCIECESHCIPTPTCADQDDEWHKDNDGSKDRHDTGGTAPGGGPYPDMTFNEDCIGNQSQRSKPSCNSHLHHTSRENER